MTKKMVFLMVLASTALVAAAALAIYFIFGSSQFGEGKFVTVYSFLQLLAIGVVAFLIKWKAPWKSPAVIWKLIGLGFVFMAVDEMFLIHENIDFLIHRVFEIEETGLTDRIDDLIVGLYGLAGLGAVIAFRNEFIPHRQALPLILIGFALMFLMVVSDTLTGRNDILPLIFNDQLANILYTGLRLVEDVFKIFAESFFLLGFYVILQKTRSTGNGAAPAAISA